MWKEEEDRLGYLRKSASFQVKLREERGKGVLYVDYWFMGVRIISFQGWLCMYM